MPTDLLLLTHESLDAYGIYTVQQCKHVTDLGIPEWMCVVSYCKSGQPIGWGRILLYPSRDNMFIREYLDRVLKNQSDQP